ncbi:MAG: carbohydrate-binding family 9-like protein [Bacteroidetes bacterium]|nr:carbohydrate-binding family 9-like protein [Bacteroidota bacterium]
MNKLVIIIIGLFIMNGTYSQVQSSFDWTKLLHVPHQYTVLKIADQIDIDGKDDEKVWAQAKWTEDFSDIETGVITGVNNRARCKMIWDDTYLYVYVEIKEANLWATLTKHDTEVFQDNAFEMFICPNGNNFNYVEFQINGFGTVWDLYLPKPYRNGGKGLTNWDIKGLKKAVRLNGSINNPNDVDTGWSIELAIPLNAVIMNREKPPKVGSIWRMNFSSVQWGLDIDNGKYFRCMDKLTGQPLPPHYSVWSPHGIIDLHYPERWGYVLFSDRPQTNSFLSENVENAKLAMWKFYYLQQEFKKINKRYAASINELKTFFPNPIYWGKEDENIQMGTDTYQFWIKCQLPGSEIGWMLDNTGEFHEIKVVF